MIDLKTLRDETLARAKTVTLDNGVQVFSEHVPNYGLANGMINIRAGANYDPQDKEGLMHFLEHMLFGKSKNYASSQERNKELDLIGAQSNAGTSAYGIMFPIQGANHSGCLLPENVVPATRAILDSVLHPEFSQEELEKEHDVIQREYAEYYDSIHNNLQQFVTMYLNNRLYSNNPTMNLNSLGNPQSISNIKLTDISTAHERFFVGPNTYATLMGDLGDDKELMKLLEQFPQGEKLPHDEFFHEKPYLGNERFHINAGNPESPRTIITYQTPGNEDLDHCEVHALNAILGGGPNSVLFNEVREKGRLVYRISAYENMHPKTGLIHIDYQTTPEQFDAAIEAVDRSLKKVKKGEFDDDLIGVVKARAIPSIIHSYKQVGGAANLIREEEFSREKGERTSFENLERMMELTKDDVVDLANRVFGENRLLTTAYTKDQI